MMISRTLAAVGERASTELGYRLALDGNRPDVTESWETQWSKPGFAPIWRAYSLPEEVQQCIDDDWFPRGGTVLDIGCGSGEIAAWIAARGYEVTGIDIASSAIAKARKAHADVPGLSFEVDDIAKSDRKRGPFDVLLDRGCLQGMGAPEYYVENVAAAAKPQARLLLYHRLRHGVDKDQTIEVVKSLFAPEFVVQRTGMTVLARLPTFTNKPIEGVVFWMTKARSPGSSSTSPS